MIAKLKGLIDETGADWAVIDVAGVGYLVHCSSKTLAALGDVGEACTVYTDLQVSENDMRLLGFAEAAERDWFRLLTQVQGVGSKVALAILSALSTAEVQQACAQGDAAMVARATCAASPAAQARCSSSVASAERIASATLLPTPCTVVSRRNQSRSPAWAKPSRRMSFSLTCRSVNTVTSSPAIPSAASVLLEQWTR